MRRGYTRRRNGRDGFLHESTTAKGGATMKRIGCALAVAMFAATGSASAWEQWISGGGGFIHNIAPQNALSVNGSGGFCLLTNDRVMYSGRIEFAHYYVYAGNGVLDPLQSNSVGHPQGLTTLGVDCRFAPPMIGVDWTDSDLSWHDDLLGRSEDGSNFWTAPLWSYGSARPARFGASAARSAVVLQQDGRGRAFTLQGWAAAASTPSDASPPALQWEMNFANSPYPDTTVVAMNVAADGTTSVIGTFSQPFAEGTFVQRYSAQGYPLSGTGSLPSADTPVMGEAAFSADGTAYFVRKGNYPPRDVLWRVGLQQSMPQPVDLSFYGPVRVLRLVVLPDDGALVLALSGYGGVPLLTRFAADGTRLWSQPVPIPTLQRTLLDVIGDRAGRAVVVSADPPGLPQRSYYLDAYGTQGQYLWSDSVPNARFDDGQPVALALTSDDRVVFALQTMGYQGQWQPGIVLRSITLDAPGP